MKNKILFSLALFFTTVQTYAKNQTTIYSQLCSINKEWLNNKIDLALLDDTDLIKTDQELIQLHLSLVEMTLRNKNVSHLSFAQKEKRNQSLDILNAYWKKGIFPVNLYHSERTPYFMDHLGTACAVGQLVIETGFGDFAKQIQSTNNYGYIRDLGEQFPLLNQWAFFYGFSIDELAWIQPTYSCWSLSSGTYSPTCPGYNDGIIYLETPVGGTPPYSVSGPPCWGLVAGNYEYTITDAVGNVYVQNYTLVDPAEISPIANWVSDATSLSECDGIASASSSGGTGPLSYYWYNCSGGGSLGNSQTINTLCPGEYEVLINDSNGCSEWSACISISNLAGVDEDSRDSSYAIFPNPTNEIITITFSAVNENSFIVLTDIFGRNVLQIKAEKTNSIDLKGLDLESGCYFVRLETGSGTNVEKIMFVK